MLFFEELRSKPNKMPEDKKSTESAKKQMDHWKEKQDFSGENPPLPHDCIVWEIITFISKIIWATTG
jgi:hypothetical protein